MDQELEEENKKRLALGLKPLGKRASSTNTLEDTALQNKQALDKQVHASTRSQRLQERLASSKSKRIHDTSVSGPSLGDQLIAGMGKSTKDWAKQFTSNSTMPVSIERLPTRPNTNTTPMQDLKVSHNPNSIPQGKEIVLTLKDSLVLDSTSSDELVNMRLLSQAQAEAKNSEDSTDNGLLPSKYGEAQQKRSNTEQEFVLSHPTLSNYLQETQSQSKSQSEPSEPVFKRRKRKAKTKAKTNTVRDPLFAQQLLKESNSKQTKFREALEEDERIANELLDIAGIVPVPTPVKRDQPVKSSQDLLFERLLNHKRKQEAISGTSTGTNTQKSVGSEKEEGLAFSDATSFLHLVPSVEESSHASLGMDTATDTTEDTIDTVTDTTTMDIEDSTTPIIGGIESLTQDPILDRGLGTVLELLRKRGVLSSKSLSLSQKVNAQSNHITTHTTTTHRPIRIEHIDEFGREMTPKQAFRQMSQIFHNKGPGMKKRAKRLREHEQEQRAKRAKNTSSSSHKNSSLHKLLKASEKSGKAYAVLDTTGHGLAIDSSQSQSPKPKHVSTSPRANSPKSSQQ